MKSDIFIHIGLHKTGTTSLQATLFHNRAALLDEGFNYLASHQNHSRLINPIFGSAPERYRPDDNAHLKAQLQRELEANSSQRLLISGEDISVLAREEIVRLRDTLAPFASRFRIIAYVRNPYATVNSLCQARLRRGETYDRMTARPPRPHYRRIENFIEVFGRDNVDIRIFEPAQFIGNDLTSDFLAATGAAPELAARLHIIRIKQALSHEASYLLNEVNRHYPPDKKTPNPGRSNDIHQWLARIPGQPFMAPHAVFASVEPVIETELRWLHDLLGSEVFAERPPGHDLPLRWSDETIAAIAGVLNRLALAGQQDAHHQGLLAAPRAWWQHRKQR